MRSRFWKIVAAFWAFVHRDSAATAEFAADRYSASTARMREARQRRSPHR